MDAKASYELETPRTVDQLWGAVVVLAGIFGFAIYMYHFQFSEGLGVTGLNKPVFWGVYIANFIFWVGLSAGGIAVSALVHLMDKKEMKPVAIMAEIMAGGFLMVAAMFIIMDLGRPTNMYQLFLHPNFTSPLLWDVTVVNCYLLLCLALLYFSAREHIVRRLGHKAAWKPIVFLVSLGRTSLSPASVERDHRCLWVLAVISIPAAVALHSVTAWILGLVKGQPGWNTPILAPLFIASALVSGFAAVTLAVIVARRLFAFQVSEEVIQTFGRYLVVAILILMYLFFSEFLTVGYSGSLSHIEVFDEILFGRFSGIFWFDAIIGILIPLLLLTLPWNKSMFTVGVASALVVIGVFAERTYLLLPSLMRPNSLTGSASSYTPTVLEWSLMAGAYAFGCLLFLGGMGLIFGRPPRAAREVTEAIPATMVTAPQN
ncbi:MAG TPA: NrfD/PsrC family molybdoenzyme membrane anchor subunit [Candidatus Binataceae bacterium]|nr:NrfD/PsrC family molybdoenzyme membrane anchor subunit [Candidatus Binataceae bacterium]